MNQDLSDGMVRIRDWIMSSHPDAAEIGLDTDLIENRLIDSLQFAEFLFVLEEVTGRAIELQDVDLDSFRTLRSVESRFLRGA